MLPNWNCAQTTENIHSQKAFKAILEMLFQHKVNKTYLDRIQLDEVDVFLKEKCPFQLNRLTLQSPLEGQCMTDDQIKATELLAKRRHREGDFLKAGLILLHLGCRKIRDAEDFDLVKRIEFLKGPVKLQVNKERI